MTRPLALLPAACAALISFMYAPPARAQDEPPAHIAVVDGSAAIEREATSEPAAPNTPLTPGDRVRTDRGRVEILFADGVVVQLDEQTTLDLQDRRLVRLLAGRLAVVSLRDRGDLQLDTPAGSVRIGPGVDARLSLVDANGRDAMEVAVMRGQAQVWTDRGSALVAAGYRVLTAIGEAPSEASPFNSAVWTDFDRWSQDRLAARRASLSYRYVPPILQSYGGVFDTYGAWGYEPVYGGYVWYPQVAGGWRPYYDGRWRFYANFGWTWIGGAVWNWPTHHYGRWGRSRAGRWFWAPGPRWAPAYVQWAVAPGYVSWCPIGFDNRPVVPFWERRAVPRAGIWNAWTVLPRHDFERAHMVHRAAIDGSRLFARADAPVFVTQTSAPAPIAIPRGGVGGRSAVGVAVPRGGGYVTYQGRTMVDVPSADRNPAPRSSRPGPAAVPRAGATGSSAGSPPPSYVGGVTTRRGRSDQAGVRTARPGTDPLVDRHAVDPRALPAAPGYGAGRAVPRSAPRTPAPTGNRPLGAPAVPDAAAPPGRSRQQWSPDQVPVHRGTPPMPAPQGYGSGPTGAPVGVPRGYGVPDRGVSPRGMPMPSVPPSRVAPPPSVRTAPPAQGRGYAVPRGSVGAPPPAAAPPPASAPPASAPPPSSSSGHSRRR
jgi:hypothetical protein